MIDPRELFPQEVWEIILEHVDKPKDILSCSQTCDLFKRHFAPTQTTWGFQCILPSLIKFLPRNDVLRCRLVSKAWLNGVDNFLQSDKFAPTIVQQLRNHSENVDSSYLTRIPNNHLQLIYYDDEPDNCCRCDDLGRQNHDQFLGWERGPYSAMNIRRFARARLNFDQHRNNIPSFILTFEDNLGKNPFPSRAVVLIITSTTICNMKQFLSSGFGRHIWSLKLILQVKGMSGFRELQFIWKILTCVPNLKHLLIKQLSGDFKSSLETDCDKFYGFLDRTATPELKQLTWLELDIKRQSIQNIITKAYGGGKSVTIFEKGADIKPCHVTNDWKHLNMGGLDGDSGIQDWKGHIRSFQLLNLPLESIQLQYSKCENFETIFQNLSKFASTLQRVTLKFTNLETSELVEMRNQVDAIYIFFLFPLKRLDSLRMIFDCAGSTEFRQFVDQILDADWIENYMDMGGVVSGYRKSGFACISAGLKVKKSGSGKLKRKYFTDGKYVRSMEMVPQ